jgi:hypothetical protein
LSLSSQKYEFGIRDPDKTYSGSRGQKGTGSGSAALVELALLAVFLADPVGRSPMTAFSAEETFVYPPDPNTWISSV